MLDIKFPKDFLWGSSTSSHQVEGNANNQWTKWEQENAEKLSLDASNDLEWLPNWKDIANNATDPKNYLSGNGIEHYARYKDDFKFLKKLGMNAFRFSFEWSRLQPSEGQWDKDVLRHYHDYIAELRTLNIEPIVTLFHWTLPTWFTDQGGFAKKDNIKYFVNYANKVIEEFGEDISYLITLNEPNVYTAFGYLTGTWPPQTKNIITAYKVYRNLISTHNRTYKVIKKQAPRIRIGIAAQLADVRALHKFNPINSVVIKLYAYFANWWFLDKIKNNSDFIGLNYYFTEYRNWRGKTVNPKSPLSDLGWYMEPSGIYPLISTVWNRYKKTIIITENGLADAEDSKREWWLEETLQALQKALTDGIDLKGYLYWSLFDNFEWAYGWWPRFGLIAINRQSMERTIRPSAIKLSEMIRTLTSAK